MKDQPSTPIFIHSLFRSGSTYMFNVFRRSEKKYWCYQEPLNEHLIFATTEPEKLLEISEETQKHLRHPELERPYFYEFHSIADEVGRHFHKEFSYDQYFTIDKNDLTELKTYFAALENGSQGRAVFQCCRTTGRIAGLQTKDEATHIFLWRNPWDQWWSYKKGFDTNNQLIANAKNLPKILIALKQELKLPEFHNTNTFVEYDFFKHNRLNATDSYKLFYAIWCHAMLEAKPYCEASINIDQLSASEAYRNKALEKLEQIGIGGLDFSDCAAPIANYGESDGIFFLGIENNIHTLLLACGYKEEQVNDLKKLSGKRKESIVDTSLPEKYSVRDAMRAREYARHSETELQSLLLNARSDTEEAKAEQLHAEAKAEQLHAELHSVYVSRSWRITAPLRRLVHQARLLRQHGLYLHKKTFVKRMGRRILSRSIVFINESPNLRIHVMRIINKLGLYGALRRMYFQFLGAPAQQKKTPNNVLFNANTTSELTPQARRIYADLQARIASQEKGRH